MEFDRKKLKILPLAERENKMTLADIKPLEDSMCTKDLNPITKMDIEILAERIIQRRRRGRQFIWLMGAHVLRRGNSRYIIDLMKRGIITHVATNLAVAIHDFELSHIGATLEDVEFYIKDGRFGNWEETGRYLNEAIFRGYKNGIGLGKAIGQMINSASNEEMPYRNISIFNAAYELGIPTTVHKGIGYDITDQHPTANFEAIGKTSGVDFLEFASVVFQLEGGVFLNLGSSVMGPEVYLKALSMARNVAGQEGREIKRFTTAVFDMVPLGNWQEEPSLVDYKKPGVMSDHRYYFRPLKSILVRTIKEGGESFYIQGDFSLTVPFLWQNLKGVA